MIGVNPRTTPEAYRHLVVAGVRSPGAIPRKGISGFAVKTDWEVKKGKGSDGASITDTGDPPKKGTVTFVLWRTGEQPGEPDDFADWDVFFIMLRAARKAKAALDIQHPIINGAEVTSVVVEEIQVPLEVSAGRWEASLNLLEWVPQPKKAPGTPGGSAAGASTSNGDGAGEGTAVPPEDAKTAQEEEFEQVANEAGF